jgi:hypothetical protein
MRHLGVRHTAIQPVHPALVIVSRAAIETVCELAWTLYWEGNQIGIEPTLKEMLTYAMYMLCGDPSAHLYEDGCEFWRDSRSQLPCENDSVCTLEHFPSGHFLEVTPK